MSEKKILQRNPGLARDIGSFLWRSKKWYLIPVLVVICIMGLLVVLGGTSAAPFVYSLF